MHCVPELLLAPRILRLCDRDMCLQRDLWMAASELQAEQLRAAELLHKCAERSVQQNGSHLFVQLGLFWEPVPEHLLPELVLRTRKLQLHKWNVHVCWTVARKGLFGAGKSMPG